MRIVSRILSEVDGIYWFPLIALIIFISFFVAIAIHTYAIKKDRSDELARLPLEEDDKLKNDVNF
jgi:cbb3-type cytochrome oxidase subunit 3